ncbi:MAG TPA: hypothetical protein VFS17_03190 [Methylophilaceae bacterium]|nr:hypothetical protein [Methylophilaceae bacterium]
MDNRKWQAAASASAPDPEASPDVGYPTDGDPSSAVPATIPGAYWFHQIGEEIRKVIADAGLTPSDADLTQLKQAIQRMIDGGDYKPSVKAATTANITLSGTQTIDGVSCGVGDRVLVKDQSTGSQNGIYVVASGAWTRSTDFDSDAEVTGGLIIPVNEGTANGDTRWALTTNDPIVVGTTALTFSNVTGLTQAAADARYTGIGYMLVRDEKAQNTSGGANTGGTTATRTLNTVVANTIPGASLSSNQITLPAGTYRVRASAPAYNVDRHRVMLYDVSLGNAFALGTTESSSSTVTNRSFVTYRFTLAATKVLELRHFTTTSNATNGFGIQVNSSGVEVYGEVEIIKES